MEVRQHVYRLGGVTSRGALVRLTSRAAVDRALREGVVVRDGHGRYAVPEADEAVRAANALAGVASHRSAALLRGWQQKHPDHPPEVTVPRRRKVSADRRAGVAVHWADLPEGDVDGHRTSLRRTLVDCLRTLPFDEALSIADSALRNGSIDRATLEHVAAGVGGPGSAQCRRVAAAADGRAANPFESVLRAVGLSVPGLSLVPQVAVPVGALVLHPDLVDVELRVVAEADSFTWHGNRAALRRDCRRYNALAACGWLVLRFAWEDVMHDPAYVETCLRDVVRRRAQRRRGRARAS